MEIITVKVVEDITTAGRLVGAMVTEGKDTYPVWFPWAVVPYVYAGDYVDLFGYRQAGGFVAYSAAHMDGLFYLPDGVLSPNDHPGKIAQFERFAGRIQNWPSDIRLMGE